MDLLQKKLILTFLFFLGFSSLICQDDEPTYFSWQPAPNKYYVIWSKDVRNNIDTSKVKIVQEGCDSCIFPVYSVPYKGHKFIPYLWAFIETDYISEIKTDYVGKIYYNKHSKKDMIVSHLFNVTLYKAEDISILEKLAEENKVKIVLEYLEYTSDLPSGSLTYLLSCTNESGDAIEVSKILYYTKLFRILQPSFWNNAEFTSIYDNIEYQKAHLYLSAYNQIDYFVPLSARSASIYISDLLGTEISRIDLEQFGSSSLVLDTNMFHSGIYFYSLFVDGVCVSTKQMIYRR
ncbi:MAG: hypothetical protein GX372_04950 [Ignavibacteria bacterium]|jgi:hypothetical protein|nr:hypothetical protein [Ignavibacteria bacterium]